MISPETLAAALRVAQDGARRAMMAARTHTVDERERSELMSEPTEAASASAAQQRDAAPGRPRHGDPA